MAILAYVITAERQVLEILVFMPYRSRKVVGVGKDVTGTFGDLVVTVLIRKPRGNPSGLLFEDNRCTH